MQRGPAGKAGFDEGLWLENGLKRSMHVFERQKHVLSFTNRFTFDVFYKSLSIPSQ
jgi:hypothetical protein